MDHKTIDTTKPRVYIDNIIIPPEQFVKNEIKTRRVLSLLFCNYNSNMVFNLNL